MKNRLLIFLYIIVSLIWFSRTAIAQSDCSLTPSDFEFSMTITAVIEIEGQFSEDSNDILQAYCGEACRGNAQPVFFQAIDKYLLFLTVYSNQSLGETISFRIFDASANKTIDCAQTFVFKSDDNHGIASNPVYFSESVLTTELSLSKNTLDENLNPGSLVGELFINPMPDVPFAFDFTNGIGDTDNSKFMIMGNQLLSNVVFNFEEQPQLSIRVKASWGQESIEKVFTIIIQDINEPPKIISLSSNTVMEGLPAGTLVGLVSATDPDKDDFISYSLTPSVVDSAGFSIHGRDLITEKEFRYFNKQSYQIRIKAEDSHGAFKTSDFQIQVERDTSLSDTVYVPVVVYDTTRIAVEVFDTVRYTTTLYDTIRYDVEVYDVDSIAGIENLSGGELALAIYPNPVKDALQIETSHFIQQIVLFDGFGHKLSAYFPNKKSFILLLNQFPVGVYFLKIETDVGTIQKKIIISK